MEKNNKIIAEFMGCENPQAWELIPSPYECDWNWLMEVVEKIYQTNLYYDKYIDSNSSMFTNGKIELSTNKEFVYNDCIEFINFYNKDKEK